MPRGLHADLQGTSSCGACSDNFYAEEKGVHCQPWRDHSSGTSSCASQIKTFRALRTGGTNSVLAGVAPQNILLGRPEDVEGFYDFSEMTEGSPRRDPNFQVAQRRFLHVPLLKVST